MKEKQNVITSQFMISNLLERKFRVALNSHKHQITIQLTELTTEIELTKYRMDLSKLLVKLNLTVIFN